MKKHFLVLCLLICATNTLSYAQDSTKVRGRMVINVQSWPNTENAVRGLKADSLNGLWIKVWTLEEDSTIGAVQYVVKEQDDCALVTQDKQNKNVFYVNPLSVQLKKKSKDVVKLEVWVVFEKKNLFYFKAKKQGELIWDKDGYVLADKVDWKPMNSMFTYEDGKYKIGELAMRVKVD